MTSSMSRKRDQAPFQQVQSCFDAFEAVFDPPSDRVVTKLEPLFEQCLETLELRPAVASDDVHVGPVRALQIGSGEQVRHQPLDVHAIGTRQDDQPTGFS